MWKINVCLTLHSIFDEKEETRKVMLVCFTCGIHRPLYLFACDCSEKQPMGEEFFSKTVTAKTDIRANFLELFRQCAASIHQNVCPLAS